MKTQMRLFRSFLCVLSALFFVSCGAFSKNKSVSVSYEQLMNTEISATMASMSLSEKASQVLMTGIDGWESFPPNMRRHFSGVVPGAVLLFKYNIADSPEAIQRYIDSCTSSFDSLGARVPVLFAIDHEGGDVVRTGAVLSRLPSARSVAASTDIAHAESLYALSGTQLASLGIRMNLAPVAEAQTAYNEGFLGTRSFSDSVDTVVSYSRSALRGYRTSGVLTVLKHFPGNGKGDPHTGLPKLDVSRGELAETYVSTFTSLLKDSPDAILVSHIIVSSIDPDTPFCLSKEGVTGLLRKSLGFNGVVITDDISMGALAKNGYSTCDAALLALEAGCDMIMTSAPDIRSITKAITERASKDRKFSARLDESVRRILVMKSKIGLVKTAQERYSRSRFAAERSGRIISDFRLETFYAARKKAGLLLEGFNAKRK
jgi:beta-N-acetylhexosaminidase